MYPTVAIHLRPVLPPLAQFWTPEPEDIDEYEGFGFFEYVWPIVDVPEEQAREILRKDTGLCQFVCGLASSDAEFDVLATSIETGVMDDPEDLSTSQIAALAPYLTETAALGGLEVGVAGLVHTLSSAGMYPAASCRGHPDADAWSPCPVVFVALDRRHAEILQPLVEQTACGFELDNGRPELLAIVSQSVEGTLALAAKIMDDIQSFGHGNS
jgi:hypothetical protein